MNLNLQLFIVEKKCFHTENWQSMSQAKWFGFPFSISFKNILWLHSVLREANFFVVLYAFCAPLARLDTWKNKFSRLLVFYVSYFLFDI